MSFFLLTKGSFEESQKISAIVKKFDLCVYKYDFTELDRTLFMFSWKNPETIHTLKLENEGFIGSIGTLIYKQKYGVDALEKINNDFNLGQFNNLDCTGHYNIIIKKKNCLYLFTDILGAWKIYKSSNELISSSYYLLLELQENLTLNKQSVYEYVLNGCTFGEKTIVNQITSLPAEKYFILPKSGYLEHVDILPSLASQPDYKQKKMEELVEDYSFRLVNLFTKYKALPTSTYRSALSGGFDSRLILGCFLKTGVSPELYVYGKKEDKDVVVANNVAKIAGLSIDFIDKSKLPNNLTLENFPSIVERNLFMYDGISYDGIFDNGNDYFDRLNRAKNNKALVNGSAGEIFRHFYYLPNRKINIDDFIKSFHSRFDGRTMGCDFSYDVYLENLKLEIQKVLHTNSQTLSRTDVEKLYPLLRARYWSAKDMINNHRFGISLYPFFEYDLINGTSTIDYDKKIYGRFEAKLIKKMSSNLAECTSDYGFPFNAEPPVKYRLKTQLFSYQRPTWLRQLSYAAQIRRNKTEWPDYLTDSYLSQVLNISFPYMSRFFKNIRILDRDTMNRLATLEYIAEKYNFSE